MMDPDEITWITDEVAITNFFSAHSPEVLARHRINAVLCLDRALQGGPAADRGVASIRSVHMVDGPNEMAVLRRAVAALDDLVQRHGRVVLHCRAGRSRSVAVTAAYLVKVRGWDAEQALEFVKAKRESAVAPELMRLVEAYEP
jgi:predicted protein tyrosine phosphatase